LVDYDEFIKFYSKLEELYAAYVIDTDGVLSLHSTFPYADIAATASADEDVRELVKNLVDAQLYETWYAGY
jgi:hypothetical protein